MWEIYWLTRLEGLYTLFIVLITLSSTVLISACLYTLLDGIDSSDSRYPKFAK